jgi:hypothetical protein
LKERRLKILRQILTDPERRAKFLNIAAEAEDSGDVMFGCALRSASDDLRPKLEKHRDDENKHAALLRGCVLACGGTPAPVAHNLQLFNRLADDCLVDLAPKDERGLSDAFALLLISEERSMVQYALLSTMLIKIDPLASKAMEQIAIDERIHVGYCKTISERYAESPEQLEETISRFRQTEVWTFRKFHSAVLGAV